MTEKSPFDPFDPDGPKPGKDGPQKVVAADGHVYHKSATANASVAPTNQHTIDKAEGKGLLTTEELDFVTTIHYEYGLHSAMPEFETLEAEYGYSQEQIKTFLLSKVVYDALEERGIRLSHKFLRGYDDLVGEIPTDQLPFEDSRHAPKLTPIQLVVANKLLDLTDTRSERKKLQDLGITSQKYQSWLRDPEFRDYLRLRAESMLGDVQHEAMLALLDRIRGGDLPSIKYYHELTGRHIEHKAANAGASGQVNYQVLLVRLIEIIEEEVTDRETAVRIGERIRTLASAGQVAGMLDMPQGEVIVPETAKSRELTPEVQALMNRGAGYQ